MFIRSVLTAGALLLAPLHPAAGEPGTPAGRNDGWAVAKPSQAGLDPDKLAMLIDEIDTGAIPNVHAVVVEQRGRLVFEHYAPGDDQSWGRQLGTVQHGPETLHDLRSVTKSVTSLLLGIALGEEAETAVTQPIGSFFPDLADRMQPGTEAITLHHVLTMTAGLEWNEMEVPYTSQDNDEIRLYFTDDPVGMVLERPVQDPPGTRWYYNGGLTQVIAGLIERRTGQPIDQFAEEVLFGPLGITDYVWMRSEAWPDGTSPSAASGLRLRARDLAKIASVVLHDGQWQGRQIVPAGWIERSTRRHVQDNPWGPPGAYGYGYFWFPGTLPGGPDVIRAVGNGDQRIFVLPEVGVSVTVFAGNYNDFRHFAGARVLRRLGEAFGP